MQNTRLPFDFALPWALIFVFYNFSVILNLHFAVDKQVCVMLYYACKYNDPALRDEKENLYANENDLPLVRRGK